MTAQVIRHEQEKERSVHLMLLEKYEGIALDHAMRLIELYKTGYVSAIDADPYRLLEDGRKFREVFVWSGPYGSGTKWTIELVATYNKSDWTPVRALCLSTSKPNYLSAIADPESEGEYFFVPKIVTQMPAVIERLQGINKHVRAEILSEWGLDPGLDDLMPGLNKAISRLATK